MVWPLMIGSAEAVWTLPPRIRTAANVLDRMQSIIIVITLAKLVARMRKSRENYPEKHTGRLLILATATLMIASLAYAETPAVPPSGCYVTAFTNSGLVRGKLSDDGDGGTS